MQSTTKQKRPEGFNTGNYLKNLQFNQIIKFGQIVRRCGCLPAARPHPSRGLGPRSRAEPSRAELRAGPRGPPLRRAAHCRPPGSQRGSGSGGRGRWGRAHEPLAPKAPEAGLPQLGGPDRRCVLDLARRRPIGRESVARVEPLQPVTQARLATASRAHSRPSVGLAESGRTAALRERLPRLSNPALTANGLRSALPRVPHGTVVGQEAESAGGVMRLAARVTSFFILMTHPAYVNRERRQQAHRS
ncbi:uncharacterized protein LOC117999251 [Mirounga leonina]|uniref:uncharacterized protein LOC117999251 n=1 Tax=Mirounga leonina TaxID=9715 RepID=UPI00156BF102|nr:uncharacterized protein LOC117999251 [Mirounga leonina]